MDNPARNGAAVVFDLDGVLVESEPYWREGFRAAMDVIATDAGKPAPRLGDEELHHYEGGRVTDTVRTLTRALFGDGVSEETLGRACEAAIARAAELFAEEPRAIEPTVRAARELHARGFRLGVASSSAPVFIETVVTRLGLADVVEATSSAFSLTYPKPHPAVYLNVLRELGVPPQAATAVEDSWPGVQSALTAGLRTVWLTDQPEEGLEARVRRLWDDDPGRDGLPRPSLMCTRAVEADAVQEFAEARS